MLIFMPDSDSEWLISLSVDYMPLLWIPTCATCHAYVMCLYVHLDGRNGNGNGNVNVHKNQCQTQHKGIEIDHYTDLTKSVCHTVSIYSLLLSLFFYAFVDLLRISISAPRGGD